MNDTCRLAGAETHTLRATTVYSYWLKTSLHFLKPRPVAYEARDDPIKFIVTYPTAYEDKTSLEIC